MEEYRTAIFLSKRYNLSVQTLYKWKDTGKVGYKKIFGSIHFHYEDCENYYHEMYILTGKKETIIDKKKEEKNDKKELVVKYYRISMKENPYNAYGKWFAASKVK